MGIQRSQEDSWTKEMAKWEQRDTLVAGTFVQAIPYADGGRKDAPFTEHPKMLYKAEMADGGPRIASTKVVKSESEELIAKGQGWAVTQEQALADVFVRQREMAEAAAHRAHQDRWMSGKAKEEADAVDESTMEHVAEIPETPIKRGPGRPRNPVPA
jgi:hypothetical protein